MSDDLRGEATQGSLHDEMGVRRHVWQDMRVGILPFQPPRTEIPSRRGRGHPESAATCLPQTSLRQLPLSDLASQNLAQRLDGYPSL